jgi:hypothetical protein
MAPSGQALSIVVLLGQLVFDAFTAGHRELAHRAAIGLRVPDVADAVDRDTRQSIGAGVDRDESCFLEVLVHAHDAVAGAIRVPHGAVGRAHRADFLATGHAWIGPALLRLRIEREQRHDAEQTDVNRSHAGTPLFFVFVLSRMVRD